MWSKRDDVPPAAANIRPIQGEPRQEAAQLPEPVTSELSMKPVNNSMKPVNNLVATIGTSMIIKGQITSADEMYIDDKLVTTVRLDTPDGAIEIKDSWILADAGKHIVVTRHFTGPKSERKREVSF